MGVGVEKGYFVWDGMILVMGKDAENRCIMLIDCAVFFAIDSEQGSRRLYECV